MTNIINFCILVLNQYNIFNKKLFLKYQCNDKMKMVFKI
jgi:hypothetical protein